MTKVVEDFHIGQTARLVRIFHEEDVKKSLELTKDSTPIYDSTKDGWKHYYEQPVVPALLSEGLITQVISEKLPGVPCLLLQKELVYYHPVHVGDRITAELSIIDIHKERDWITQKVTCFNQHGDEVIKGQVVNKVLTRINT